MSILKPWTIKHSTYLVNDRWLKLRADCCETADGREIDPYYVLEFKDWVHVVALDKDNRILITRQYRHAAGVICAEIPCGEIESGESPRQAIERELLEETGCVADTFELVQSVYPNPARQNNRTYCFLAQGTVRKHEPKPDEFEQIASEFVAIEDVLAMMERGEFSQAMHIGTLYAALVRVGFLRRAT